MSGLVEMMGARSIEVIAEDSARWGIRGVNIW